MPPAESALTPIRPKYPPACGLMHAVADLLIPIFTSPTVGVEFAQKVARSALDNYRPETGADYVNAARTLAFSMAALSLLGQAVAADLPLQQKMRVFGRATALNRSADQSERTMMQRRRLQTANPPAELRPTAPEPELEPNPQEIATSIAEAMAVYDAACSQERPETPAQKRPIPPAPTAPAAPSVISYGGPNRHNMPPLPLITPEQIRRVVTGHR
jgi:hypothetical protein